MLRHGLLAAVLLLSALASVAHSARLYHRDGSLSPTAARPTTRNTWTATAIAPPTAAHTVTIALPLHNREHMEQLFHDIHDPTHPQWLNHLTRQQIHAIVAPPQHATDRLLQWMQYEQQVPAGHIEYLIGANAVRVNSTIEHINRLFNTTMHEFTHTDGHTTYRQLGSSYVPDELVPLIHLVDGLAMMPYAMKKHIRLLELEARSTQKQPLPLDATLDGSSSSEENRHGQTAGSGSRGSDSTPPLQASSPAASLGLPNQVVCGFRPMFPVNSMYGWYNITDQSRAAVGTNPTTSTQTVQFFTTGDNRGGTEANSFSPSDLSSYSRLWSQSGSGSALKVQTVTGPNDASNPTDEPSLDVQSITSLNPVAANQFELTANGGQQFWWAAGFVSRENIAQVVSISYGTDESVFVSPAYANRRLDNTLLGRYLSATNDLYMLIGARGTTILASSGDDGAQGLINAEVYNGTQCNYLSSPYYGLPPGPSTEFPAISPYVTAVGGTEISASCSAFPAQLSGTTSPICSGLTTSKLQQYGVRQQAAASTSYRCLEPAMGTSESAVSLAGSSYTSGGGFSRHFTRADQASWQDSVVNSWLSSSAGRPRANMFNSSGRAIPDVSMYGGEFPIILGATLGFVVGTSLSAPLFAAIISILNQQTLDAKQATIGFANPLLYAMAASSPATFNDIISGDNICPISSVRGSTTCASVCQGYSAARGWDPVTGLGVPNVGAMQAALAQYLYLAQGTQTGSVTGITGSSGGANSLMSQPGLLCLLVVAATLLTVLVL